MVAAQGGDRVALDRLLRRHHDRLYAVCVRITGNEADGADACQNALVAIVKALPRFDGLSRFSTWAYRVATNASLDELRRRRRRPELVEPGAHAHLGAPDAGIDDLADHLAIRAALASLSPEQRAPVVLRDLAGLSYEEIAEILSLPPGTVRSRISRGRAVLAGTLSDARGAGPGNLDLPPRRPTAAGSSQPPGTEPDR